MSYDPQAHAEQNVKLEHFAGEVTKIVAQRQRGMITDHEMHEDIGTEWRKVPAL